MSRYIDADHLRKWILSWWERTEPTSEYLKGRDILNQIDREPTIEPKRGEWKNHKDEHYCTNCGEVVIDDWYDENEWYAYCPNCGARMKGADDE